MCDYSLMEVPNRLAEEGERLQVYAFHTGTKGLIANVPERRSLWQEIKDFFAKEPESLPCAVCIPPGAQLRLQGITLPIQKQFGVTDTEEVTFTQLHADAGYHRDAVRFKNGLTLTLQRLQPGQQVDVLSLALLEEEEAVTPSVAASRYELVTR